MTYVELFDILSKSWLNVNDIKKIGSCGRNSAIEVRNKIITSIQKEGLNLPKSKTKLVPTKEVIDYFNLDIDFISLMAHKEKELAT